MPSKKVFWLCVFALVSHIYRSQNLNFNYYKVGTDEGMNSLNVFNLQQDANGLMHVTTDNGVYLYNGYNFTSIKNKLTNPTINSSFIKDNSTIYLSTREYGIKEINYKTRDEKNLTENLKINNLCDQILVNGDFIYLLQSSIRLDIVDLKTNTYIKDAVKEVDKNNQAHCIYKTKDGKILAGRSDGLYEVNGSVLKKLDLFRNLPVYSMTENNKGELLIGSASKIYIIKDNKLIKEIVPVYKTKTSTFSMEGEKSIQKILCDSYDRIWFTSSPNENIYVYYKGVTHDVFNELNITPILINCIYRDRDENIWIGTMDDGIYVLQNTFFDNISINPDNKPLSVNKIFFKNDLILTATSNGFFAYNFMLNDMKTISEPDNFANPIYDIKEHGSVIYYTKRSQFDLSAGIIVSGSNSYKFKPILGKLLYKLDNGNIVLADWMANVLLTNSDASKVLDTLISFTDFSKNVTSIYAQNDSLLIGTNKGLIYYNFKTKLDRSASKNPDKKVNDIALVNGQIVICHEDGIEFLNTQEEIKTIGSKSLNGVKKIRQKNDVIWIVTTDGLYICDKQLNPLKIYNRSNGILSSSINDISFSDRFTCISTSKGISIAQTNDIIQRSTTIDAISIDVVKINERRAYYDGRTTKLSSNDNDVTIFFNSPYYSKQGYKQFFRYKLDNSNWVPFENPAINIPALEGGKHKIQIQASADNINWSNSTVIEFDKEAKFSETRYSFIIIILIATVIASLISYLIIKRVKKRALKRIADEQQVNLLKHQAMNSLLSPHFIFNSLTSIQNYINSNNSLKASEYLAKFSRLIRMIIEKAAQSEIILKDEVTRLTYYLELEKERFKNKFDYQITVDEKLDINTVAIPNMIIQPHAENCIIHGILPKMEHGKLDINFKKTDGGKLLITIEDDGIGLIKAKEHSKTGHKSLGTATIKNILELNSKLTGKTQVVTMVDKSTLGKGQNGTIITLELEL